MELSGNLWRSKIFPKLSNSTTYFSTYLKKIEYKKCYRILGIPDDSDQEQVRSAYLKLVKKYHPDSGTKDASVEKFHEIDNAFKTLMNKMSKERWNVDEVDITSSEEYDIKHTAPQHRQYLNFEGIGVGTPFQREKQYHKVRARVASENVLKHRIAKVTADDKALMEKDPAKHKIKTKYGLERLVEDLIQESMSKGEFSKLSGAGKPLKQSSNRNPYVDFITHKLNEVLIDNGFTPEWITLHKEIRAEIADLRNILMEQRANFGPCPLSPKESENWAEIVAKYELKTKDINTKIDKFNLVVPILNKQIFHLDVEKEAQKVLINGKHRGMFKKLDHVSEATTENREDFNLFSIIDHLFKK